MAEMNTSESGGKKKHGGKKRSKKMSTKVDLTPMVDLAFLLITFFMLTTTLNKPNAMGLVMPKKVEDEVKEKVKEYLVLNLILDKDNQIQYYEGMTAIGLKTTTFSKEKGVRDVIYAKMNKIRKEKHPAEEKIIVLIKNTDEAKYNNLVDILDEMSVTGVKTYAIQDVQKVELQAIKNGGSADIVPEK
ncbi:MAG: biopolymer transporter ExbD [Bacteroidia bacterium]|nr:biopolymer transporter ExbD [Bacteroidia bacterium]